MTPVFAECGPDPRYPAACSTPHPTPEDRFAMERLDGARQSYDWGSTTAIPEMLGLEPDGAP